MGASAAFGTLRFTAATRRYCYATRMSRDRDDREKRERMAIEPTIPATDVRAGVPDFSSERPAADAGPGRATVGVIVGVVVVVGALFLWLGGSKPAPAAATTAAAAPSTSAATKPSTSAATKPAKAAAKPAAAASAAAPPVAAPAANAKSTTAPAAAAESAPAAHLHAAATPAHKRHKKPTARAAKHKEVKLPRLPSPPPADP